MRSHQFRELVAAFLIIAIVFVLLFLLWWKLQLGLVRYFDADEFAYLHWAHNVFRGDRPYYDFLSNVPTIFWYVLAPLYYFVRGTDILTVSRLFGFVIQVGIAVILITLGKAWRGIWVGVLAAGIFLFLPLPSDKLLEVRPDNLSLLFALLGMWFQIRLLQQSKEFQGLALKSGIWYGLSLVILPKTLPIIGAAVFVTLLWWLRERKSRTRSLRLFLAGLLIPLVGFVGVYLIQARSIHEIDTFIYTVARFPFEVNRISEQFVLQPDLFFYPNAIYYGSPGWSAGLIVNHSIWFIGLMMMVGRLLTPLLPLGRSGVFGEVLIAGSGVASVVSFVLFFTFRHAQYLIPSAVFVSLFAADGISSVWNAMPNHRLLRVSLGGLGIVCLFWLGQIFVSVNSPKLLWTNAEDARVVTVSLRTIPENAYVFDLVGATIYFRDPYYVCCVPFGQWEPYLSRPLPRLSEVLEKTQTRYVYQGKLDRVVSLSSEDRDYIASRFLPSREMGEDMLVRRP